MWFRSSIDNSFLNLFAIMQWRDSHTTLHSYSRACVRQRAEPTEGRSRDSYFLHVVSQGGVQCVRIRGSRPHRVGYGLTGWAPTYAASMRSKPFAEPLRQLSANDWDMGSGKMSSSSFSTPPRLAPPTAPEQTFSSQHPAPPPS